MSHADEGTIHAFLDGALAEDPQHAELEAHLAGCAECRARLDNERAVRERAAHVLRTMAPDAVRVEPFEQMIAARRRSAAAPDAGVPDTPDPRARVKQTDTAGDAAGRTGRRFFMPLTLAATVVLAVTGTWMANRLRMESAKSPDLVGEADFRKGVADAPPSEGAAVGADANESRRQAPPASSDSGRREADLRSVPPPVMPSDFTRTAEVKTETQEREGARTITRPADRTANVLRDQVQRTPAQQQQLRPQLQQMAGQAALYEVAQPQALLGAIADSLQLLSIDQATRADWRNVTRDDATRILGRAPAGIEGLAVLATEVASVGTDSVVRITLQLDSLNTIEILQWPAVAVALNETVIITGQGRADDSSQRRARSVAADSVPPRAGAPAARAAAEATAKARDESAAVNTVTVPMIGVKMIALRGRLAADSLRILAARVR
jgi:hypothetical protein